MSLILNNLNYPALKFHEETSHIVEDICNPLFKYFKITTFGFVKIFSNGKMLRITNRNEWTKRYFECQYYNDTGFYHFDDISENSSKVRIFTNNPQGGLFNELYDYNIWNIFSLYEKDQHSIQIWSFATSRENTNIIDFYANERMILDNFIFYFKDKAAPLLIEANEKQLITTQLQLNQVKAEGKKEEVSQFLKEIGHHVKQKYSTLTAREVECMKSIIIGNSAKETAILLGVSPRTIESHVAHIKNKLGCKKITQLLKIFAREFE